MVTGFIDGFYVNCAMFKCLANIIWSPQFCRSRLFVLYKNETSDLAYAELDFIFCLFQFLRIYSAITSDHWYVKFDGNIFQVMDCISNKMQPLIAWMRIGCFQCDRKNRKMKSFVLSAVNFMRRGLIDCHIIGKR